MRADLSTIGAADFAGRLTTPFTGHPKCYPTTGEMVFVGYDLFESPFLRYHVVDRHGALVRTPSTSLAR